MLPYKRTYKKRIKLKPKIGYQIEYPLPIGKITLSWKQMTEVASEVLNMYKRLNKKKFNRVSGKKFWELQREIKEIKFCTKCGNPMELIKKDYFNESTRFIYKCIYCLEQKNLYFQHGEGIPEEISEEIWTRLEHTSEFSIIEEPRRRRYNITDEELLSDDQRVTTSGVIEMGPNASPISVDENGSYG